MSDRIFIDTNILVYGHSADDAEKRSIVSPLLRSEERSVISTQIIGEFVNVSLRKQLYSFEELMSLVSGFQRVFEIVPVLPSTFNEALGIKQRYGFSWWDSVVVASALEAKCDVLMSEDLQDGQIIGGRLTVSNPFA